MIDKDEIEDRSRQLDIHTSNVQRDYVFGWLISGLYQASELGEVLVLKGGNALRKGYFPLTRFSDDLDFTTQEGLSHDLLTREFNRVCSFAQDQAGIRFDLERNQVADEHIVDSSRRIYKLRLYFKDFYGNADHITLKVRVDVTEYDRIYLPSQIRRLIHQYSDSDACTTEIRSIKLEEALADKLKCLLQRRHSHDLFDLVYAIFISKEFEVVRSEVVQVFLKKTIFEPSPVAAKRLLLGLPFDLLKSFWNRIVCPSASRITFESATALLREGIEAMFAPFGYGEGMVAAFFPPEIRNPIMQAASERRLLHLRYDGVPRLVEPYSLSYKRRKDGIAQEYFYGFDLVGGRSGPGIKAFLHGGIQAIEVSDQPFDPRFEIELNKAGGHGAAGYFTATRTRRIRRRSQRPRPYVVQCSYCGKEFRRSKPSSRLNPHQDGYGNRCPGRMGYRIA